METRGVLGGIDDESPWPFKGVAGGQLVAQLLEVAMMLLGVKGSIMPALGGDGLETKDAFLDFLLAFPIVGHDLLDIGGVMMKFFTDELEEGEEAIARCQDERLATIIMGLTRGDLFNVR